MRYADLSDYVRVNPISKIKNIGWLESGFEYEVGAVSDLALRNLREIGRASDPRLYTFNRMRGYHYCSICAVEKSSGEADRPRGNGEILVPDKTNLGSYFAAPALIVHYVENNAYRPRTNLSDLSNVLILLVSLMRRSLLTHCV